MLNKALLLCSSPAKKADSESSQTTGKFTVKNGYCFINTDSELPNWGDTLAGYRGTNDAIGSWLPTPLIGECSPVPTLLGRHLTGLVYMDSADMGTYGSRVSIGSSEYGDTEWGEDTPTYITLINYSKIYTNSAFKTTDGRWNTGDTSYNCEKCFTDGENNVWEIRAGEPGPLLIVDIEIGSETITSGTVTKMFFNTTDEEGYWLLQYSQTWGEHSLPISLLADGVVVEAQTELSKTVVVSKQNVDVQVTERVAMEMIAISIKDRSKDAYIHLRIDGVM